MNLHVLSDLHLEFGDFDPPDVSPDAVVIAGDLHRGTRGLQWAADRLPDVPIIYVVGNHEYYGHSLPKLAHRIREKSRQVSDRLCLLNQDQFVLGDTTFLGVTLWTDFNLRSSHASDMIEAGQSMSDYRMIRVDPTYRRLRPRDTSAIHARELDWLRASLAETQSDKVVVVTHHAPSLQSVDPRLASDPLSAAYASNLDDIVAASGADLWVHGHTHFATDYLLGTTRVVSNPRGYVPSDVAAGFRPDLIVEI